MTTKGDSSNDTGKGEDAHPTTVSSKARSLGARSFSTNATLTIGDAKSSGLW